MGLKFITVKSLLDLFDNYSVHVLFDKFHHYLPWFLNSSRFIGCRRAFDSSKSLKTSLMSTVRFPSMEAWFPAKLTSWAGNGAANWNMAGEIWPGLAWEPSKISRVVIAELCSSDLANILIDRPWVCKTISNSSFNDSAAVSWFFYLGDN